MKTCDACGCRGHFDLCPNKCHAKTEPASKKYVLTWEEYLRMLSKKRNIA